MDASTSGPTQSPSPGDTNTINVSPYHDTPRSSDRQPVAVVAKQRIMKAGAFGSPVRRSPRLSCLPPPLPSVDPQDTQDLDESSDSCANEVALYLSRDETLENDDLPPDEPSSVLANRIMRAHDNPSPPPQDLAHPGINYVPGKDGQFPLASVSVPPSPFRAINLLERLNHSPHSTRTPSWGIRPDMSQSDPIPPRGFSSSESSPLATSVRVECTENDGLAPADTIPSSSIQCAVDALRSQSSQHVCEPVDLLRDAVIDAVLRPTAQRTTITSSLESEACISLLEQAVDSSLNHAVPSISDGGSPCSERSVSKPSALPANAGTLPLPSSNENGMAPSGTQTTVPCGKGNCGEESLSVDNSSSPDADSLQRPNASHSAGPCPGQEPTPSADQTLLSAESIPNMHQPAIPPKTPGFSVMHPDFSRTSVQRPVIAPTPVRANSARKFNSPSKLLVEVDDIYRTPAQRVPIETAFSRGTSPFQRTVQLSTDRTQPGRFLTIKAPIFTRPALDDVSRSPAKRIPITNSAVSPTRIQEAQASPTQLGLCARSTAMELRPLGTIFARSRSIEPCATISKPDKHGKIKESIFPVVPTPSRSGTKLPFPLVPGQKSSSDLPPSIPEKRENTETGKPETDVMSGSNPISHLRQPSSSSRIPRIGNKPYARPPRTGKATSSTMTANNARASRVPQFQLSREDSGVGNNNAGLSSQLANDRRLVGSLKRKRGTEAALPNSFPIMLRQVVPGVLGEKYTPKHAKVPSQIQLPPDLGLPKAPQPLKFRKVVDGMLSARYAQAKANPLEMEPKDPSLLPPSPPLSELSSLSDEVSSDEKLLPSTHAPAHPKGKPLDPRTNPDPSVVEPSANEHSSLHQDADDDKLSSRLRRTSRTRRPAQQQYVLDVFNSNTSIRLPPARRKTQSRTESDCFMGMSATALRALTTSNTTKNQQTVAVLATEVIRKEGLRPESPTVKARTVLQKQRDERDMRRRERAQKRAQMGGKGLADEEAEGQSELEDSGTPGTHAKHDEHDFAKPQKHRQGPGDEEDYETPEGPGRIDPLRLEGVSIDVKPMKQVKWHRGLSTAVYLDEVDPKRKSLPMNVVVRGCLAPTSKNLPLDPLGNVDLDNRPSPELVTEHIVVKRYLYDNDIEPDPIPPKITRSKSKKSKS